MKEFDSVAIEEIPGVLSRDRKGISWRSALFARDIPGEEISRLDARTDESI